MKKKINRYLRCYHEVHALRFYQKCSRLHGPMLRSVQWAHRQRVLRRSYTAYEFTKASFIIELAGQDTQPIDLPYPIHMPPVEFTIKLPPTASHLFERPDSDPRMN